MSVSIESMAVPPSGMVSLGAAARYRGVSTRTIRRYVSRGELRAYRVGGHLIQFRISDLDALAREIPTVGRAS